jgi:hypothetical protein
VRGWSALFLFDKLTAFAPNTTGIAYGKRKEIEIIKQLYDIDHLFNEVDDITVIKEVFSRAAEIELAYRELAGYQPEEVLNDILPTSLCIATRGTAGKGNFDELNGGIQKIVNYICYEPYHSERAMLSAAKAAYLCALLKSRNTEIMRFYKSMDMSTWEIGKQPLTNRLNRLKKTNAEAFFYWYQTQRLLASF